jgi:hypothetical protein
MLNIMNLNNRLVQFGYQEPMSGIPIMKVGEGKVKWASVDCKMLLWIEYFLNKGQLKVSATQIAVVLRCALFRSWDLPEVSLCKYLVRNLFLAGPPFSLSELVLRADLVKFRGLSQSESDSAERGRSIKSPIVVVMCGGVITKFVGSSSS